MDHSQMATNAAEMLDAARMLIEVVSGYRRAAIEAGFTEHEAGHLAIEYHRHLLTALEA